MTAQALAQLPLMVRDAFGTAFTASLNTVFLVAARRAHLSELAAEWDPLRSEDAALYLARVER